MIECKFFVFLTSNLTVQSLCKVMMVGIIGSVTSDSVKLLTCIADEYRIEDLIATQ